MVKITENAKTKVLAMLAEEGNPKLNLRTFVQGGGCSGMEYGFTFDEEKNEDDFELPLSEERLVLIDVTSMQYLAGATIDFKEDLSGARFSIENPNAESSCGCGSSFNPG